MEEQRLQIVELEDEVQLLTDAKLRLEVNLGALQKRVDSGDADKAEELNKELKKLSRRVRELEDELEAERSSREKLNAEKRKMEMALAESAETYEEQIR